MSNFDEAVGQDVVEESSHKGDRVEGGELPVLGCEFDGLVVGGDEPLVGDGDAMGVSAEVLEDVAGAGEGSLGVDDPAQSVESVEEAAEAVLVIDVGGLAGDDVELFDGGSCLGRPWRALRRGK